jgi:hypothetical protein
MYEVPAVWSAQIGVLNPAFMGWTVLGPIWVVASAVPATPAAKTRPISGPASFRESMRVPPTEHCHGLESGRHPLSRKRVRVRGGNDRGRAGSALPAQCKAVDPGGRTGRGSADAITTCARATGRPRARGASVFPQGPAVCQPPRVVLRRWAAPWSPRPPPAGCRAAGQPHRSERPGGAVWISPPLAVRLGRLLWMPECGIVGPVSASRLTHLPPAVCDCAQPWTVPRWRSCLSLSFAKAPSSSCPPSPARSAGPRAAAEPRRGSRAARPS